MLVFHINNKGYKELFMPKSDKSGQKPKSKRKGSRGLYEKTKVIWVEYGSASTVQVGDALTLELQR